MCVAAQASDRRAADRTIIHAGLASFGGMLVCAHWTAELVLVALCFLDPGIRVAKLTRCAHEAVADGATHAASVAGRVTWEARPGD